MNRIATIEEILDESMSCDAIETSVRSKPCNRPDRRRTHWRCDRGEGVISTAIAVLIMAFLGAAMWVAFNTIWSNAEGDIKEQIEIIGSSSTS